MFLMEVHVVLQCIFDPTANKPAPALRMCFADAMQAFVMQHQFQAFVNVVAALAVCTKAGHIDSGMA